MLTVTWAGKDMADGAPTRLHFEHQQAVVPFEGWRNSLCEELDAVAAHTAAPLNAAFAKATRMSLDAPEMAASLQVLWGVRGDSTGPEAYRRIRTAAQRLLLKRPEKSYPYDYRDYTDMLEGLQWIHVDPDRTESFRRELQEALHTAVSQRYIAELIVGMALRHTLSGSDLMRLDIGCSNNSGNVRLLSGYGFDALQVLGPPAEDGGRREVDPDRTQLLNEQLALHASSLVIPRVVGIDRVDMTGGENSGIVEPAWYTPDEIANGVILEQQRKLAELGRSELDEKQLRFLVANAAVAEDVSRLLRTLVLERRRFDVVSAIASLYQNSAGQLKRIRDNVTGRLLNEDGYAYILDFLGIKYDQDSRPYITRAPKWTQMNLLVYGGAEGELRRSLRRIAWFQGGRAHTIAFTSAFARLAQGGPFEEIARDLSPPKKQ